MSSSPLLTSVRRLRRILAIRSGQDQSDEQLLNAFTARRDDAAFAALVGRHGPMVLGVCRRVLGHEQDAEDAFQATFLVLAQKAAELRNKTALAGFLHGTAFHVASRARRAAGRRRTHESSLGALTQPRSPANPAYEMQWREVRAILDEEIARLPKSCRSVFVLCCLEELTQAEAGRRLGLKERTVSDRLAQARKRLARRLSRRGIELTAVLGVSALAAPSSALMAGTIDAAMTVAVGQALTGVVSATVAELVTGATTAMMVSKAKIATVILLAASMLAGAGAWTYRTAARTPSSEPKAQAPAAPSSPVPERKPAAQRPKKTDSVTVTGRVLAPDGKPAAGANVYFDLLTPEKKPPDSTTTGKDGRFSFTLSRTRLVDPETKFPLRTIRILATAKGFGLDWLEMPLDDAGKEATLRLVNDDVPIQGRIISLEGKPLAGIKVSVHAIEAFPKRDLSRALAAYRMTKQVSDITDVRILYYRDHLPVQALMATTGADGRFRLDGIGRERIAMLNVEGTGIHSSWMNAMTRRAETVRGSYSNTIYGATFEYLAKPSRLIRGTVREKGTGKPLAGIFIHDMGFTGRMTSDVMTDAQGRYELHGCSKGAWYGLSASASHGQPYLLSSIGIKDTAGLGPLTADLEMVRGIPCEGKVIDGETGQPVPGTIEYYPLYPNPNVKGSIGLGKALRGTRFGSYAPFSQAAVHADGSFRCAVLPGGGCLAFRATETNRYVLACVDPIKVKARGDKMILMGMCGEDKPFGLFQEQYQAIRLIDPDKDTKKVSEMIRIAVARQVLGTIVDAEGKPLTGVRVRGLKRWEWKTLQTAKFSVYGVNPERPRQLYFVHEAKHLIGSVEVKGAETKPLTVRLQPWAAVRGRLLDADGIPLRHAKIHGNGILPENIRTDDEGRFRMEGFIPGLRYNLTYNIDKQSKIGMLLKGFVGKPGEVRDLGDVRGQPSRQE